MSRGRDPIKGFPLPFFSPLSQFTELARCAGVSVLIIKLLVEQTAFCLATFPHLVCVPAGTPHPTPTPQLHLSDTYLTPI